MKILITGGTGSLGHALVRNLLALPTTQKIVIFSRDEYKQHLMEAEFGVDQRIRYYVGDVREPKPLRSAMEGMDACVLAHALKRVDQIELNPREALKTNVLGVQNAIDAALEAPSMRKVLLISTDKAVEPANAYGFTKGMAERLIVSANFYRGPREIAFAACRYGNVFDSRGSVVFTWRDQVRSGIGPTITSTGMTRFHLKMREAAEVVRMSLVRMHGGEIFVPDLPAYELGDLLSAFRRVMPFEGGTLVGMRPGEKEHELLISKQESRRAAPINNVLYAVLPDESLCKRYGLTYDVPGQRRERELSSQTAVERMTVDALELDIREAILR